MCKKLFLLVCLVTLLGMSNIAFADELIFMVDFSCPGEPNTVKGGDWEDFEVNGGCDGEQHDARLKSDVYGTDIDIRVGSPTGVGNIHSRTGDAICNTSTVSALNRRV